MSGHWGTTANPMYNPAYAGSCAPPPSAPPLPPDAHIDRYSPPLHDVVPGAGSSAGYPPQGGYVPSASYGQPSPPQQQQQQQPRPPMDMPWVRYGISQDDYDYICALFCNFDDDDGGSLDRTELTRLARWLNYPHAPADIDTMYADLDKRPGSKVNMDEFLRFYLDKKPNPDALYGLTQRQYNEVLLQFRSNDADGDGLLSVAEFCKLARAQEICFNDADATDMFHSIDTDRSGQVDLHEFLVAMKPFRIS